MAYVKHTWSAGDVPTATQFNQIEDGIDAALRRDGGTMTGALVTKTGTDYSTFQARNIKIQSTDMNVGDTLASGQIVLVYES